MPCIKAPRLPRPTLPNPLKIKTTFPDVAISAGANFCCNIHVASPTAQEIYGALGGPPLPPGPVINTAVLQTLLGYIDQLNAYLDKLSIDCPLDG